MFIIIAANLKLRSFEGCRRCCNSSILFCNKPDLPLSEMGIDDDLTINIQPIFPVNPNLSKILAKALFRRAKCHIEMRNYEIALNDLELSLLIIPNEPEILLLKDEVISAIANAKKTLDDDKKTLDDRLVYVLFSYKMIFIA